MGGRGRGLAAAVAIAAIALPSPAHPVGGAAADEAPGDHAMAAAEERTPPPKKRGVYRIHEDVDETRDFLDEFQDELRENDLVVGFDAAFYDQYASDVRKGGNNAATFTWQLFVDYEVYDAKDKGAFHFTGTFLGSTGLDYDDRTDALSDRVGSISIVNGNVYPDDIAFDELYVHWVSPEARWVLALGKLDMSYFFDTNRVANDAYRQFTAFTFENDISIPFPIYGGFGLLGRWNPTEDTYLLASASDASSNERVPWGSVADGSWWQLLEFGITFEPRALGTGNYRITGWHSDAGPGNGFGIGINIDQNLGIDWLIGFLRAGTGDPSQTDIQTAFSGGVSVQDPFGRTNDEAGVGLSWAHPTDGTRDETFFETFYRFSVTKRVSISPFLQLVIDPAQNLEDEYSVIGAVRLLWML